VIARTWHGRTAPERADEYEAFLAARAIPDYRSIAGNLGAWVLRCDAPDATHFVTLTFWESESAIRAFAGEPISAAKYYPEDAEFLLEYEPEVKHWRITSGESSLSPGS
jgi:heme-degrading monooxygenase HmoA